MALHTDTVRAICVYTNRREFTQDEIKEQGSKIVEAIRSMPIIKANITKYEVCVKAERLGTTLAADLGLNETEFTTVVIIEGPSHEKVREALTHPDYRALLEGGFKHGATTKEDVHIFSSEYITII
ncbi:hypothetical protein K438DRAFT_1962083 [Mycena galopus ATCC 62051]|nr:hypothetical protein K438DRAFT_1962083 [Mycena galopus ATCC 62051]